MTEVTTVPDTARHLTFSSSVYTYRIIWLRHITDDAYLGPQTIL